MNSPSKNQGFLLLLLSVIYLTFVTLGGALASDGHGEAHGDAQKDEHGHAHEETGDEAVGFKLTPEAFKNFGIQLRKAEPGVAMTLPKKSIFFGLEERNLYRYREGYFKRIDFKTLSKTKTDLTVSSDDLKTGDQIATEGLGFLRIAELAAFGGVAEGHSH